MTETVKIQIIYSVNAGICIVFPDHQKVWIDFFPDGETPLFSHIRDEQWDVIKKDPQVSPPDLILFSHTHPDHFSAARVKECSELWNRVPVYFPAGSEWRNGSKEELPHVPICGEETDVVSGELKVRMIRTVHSGKQFIDVPHYSFLFNYQGRQIFVAGDALVTGEGLSDFLEFTHIDLAVLTFPWASTSIGRERVEYTIQPSHVLLYHIPNAEDNRNGFREAAESGKQLLNCPDVRSFTEPFQSYIFNLS